MKSFDVKSNTYINFNKEINDKKSKFKIDDNVRISKYKNFLQKITRQYGLRTFLRLKS